MLTSIMISMRKRYRIKQIRDRYRREVEEHIKSSNDCPIHDLSDEQKKEIVNYWKKYNIELSSTEWHKYYYAKTGLADPRFVPDDIFQCVIKPRLNNHQFSEVWCDKSYTDKVLHGIKTVKNVLRHVNGHFLDDEMNVISLKEGEKIIQEYEQLVVKPTLFTDTGKNVELLHAPFELSSIMKKYGLNFVMQIPLIQHPQMALLNDSSVNTMRINSVFIDNTIFAVPAFVKAGQPGQFTDNGGGEHRIFIGIDHGKFTNFAFDHDCNKFYEIPSGYKFGGDEVPFLNEACDIVKKAHKCIQHFGLAFWDVAIDSDGNPVIVEMNLRYPDTYFPQIGSGPFFGDATDIILSFVQDKENI